MSHNPDHRPLLSRREFTVESALALLAGVVITVGGCSSNSNPTSPTPGTGGGAQDITGDVSANHGHVATITAAQVTAAGALSLNIMGSATHPHTVSLLASQVQQIGAKQRLVVTSTTDTGHDHTVTFN